MTEGPERRRVVVVTGLSGAGKLSVLGALEDLGFDTVDNPPLELVSEMVGRSGGKVAIGVDARTRGFDAGGVVATLAALRGDPVLRPELVYVTADETTLLRRYTESRRRHPLAPDARVADGIAQEQALTGLLREAADLVLDTSDLPLAAMRRLIGLHFGADATAGQLVVTLTSFAYRQGLPREADLVFDSRFLRNPHYEPTLRARTGQDPEVGAFIAADPDFAIFFERVAGLVEMLLPRFVQEGKKYATIAIGCTGGRHRSVYLVEKLATRLAGRHGAERSAGGPQRWRLHVMHRELARAETITAQPVSRRASGQGGATIIDDRLGAALAGSGTGGLDTI
jgi:RNase adapter protein RapZ